MEIISAPTDLNVPAHYFPLMSTMAKSLSPPSLEQLDNEVDMNLSPATSYSCPILSSVSPDRLRAPVTTVSSTNSVTEMAVATQQQQQQQQQLSPPMTTVAMTSSPSKLSTSTTVPAMLPSGKGVRPPLDLSSSPERQHSPHHYVVDPQEHSMTTLKVIKNAEEGNAPVSGDSWMQFLRQMSNFYSKSMNQSGPGDTHPSIHNNSNERSSRSGQFGGCPAGLANTYHNNDARSSVDNEALLANSQQFDWFLRFQSMLNGMNQMATGQNQNLDTEMSSPDTNPLGAGSHAISNLPEPFKYLVPLMTASSDHTTKPTTSRQPNLFVSEDQNMQQTSDAQTDESSTLSNNRTGVCPPFSTQDPAFSSPSGVIASNEEFNPSSSTSLAFTASLLAMLTANHKANSSSPVQPYQPTITSSADNHSSLPIPTPLFSHTPLSMPKLTDAPFLSSTIATSPGVPIGMENVPSYAVSNLPTSDQLAQFNASLFALDSHKQGVPDAINLFSGIPQQVTDNRGLLYQIGQRLMAMATLSDFMNSAPYPTPLGPTPLTSDRVMNTSCAQPSSLGQSLPSASSASPFNNSVEAAVAAAAAAAASAMGNQCGSNFFPCFPKSMSTLGPKHGFNTTTSSVISPSLSSPSGLSSASSASPTLATPVTGMNLINENKTTGLEKSLMHQMAQPPHHPLMTSGAGLTNLSGISMRGNQKYSAYYQNQRKQGFSVASAGASGTIAGDYFCGNRTAGNMGSTGSSRRPGFPGSNLMLNSRYPNRRFRGHLSNLPSLTPNAVDSKASGQRIPGSRANPLGLGGSTYPGYRNVGMGYKGSLPGASPGFSPHPSVGAGSTVGSKPGTASFAKGHGPTDTGLPTGQSGSATESVGAVTSRHKDTAFLCSCGRDFENLYVFIIHMKDTGHKPKSDHCDKDIPKLVRGQDMWINSETEQTREILRCMRCHQSFRSLPELTLHMMKTNHYSEIVYNDSGRLVFVNPDEQRRGPPNSSNSTPSVSTSGKVSPALSVPNFPTRRSWKTLNYTPTTTTNVSGSMWTNGPSTSLSDHSEDGRRIGHKPEVKSLHQSTIRTTESDDNQCDARQYSVLSQVTEKPSGDTTPTTMSAAVSPTTKDSSLYTEIPDCGSDRGSQKSIVSLKSDSCTGNSNTAGTSGGEINVLRQIESFVENSLPTGSKCLSVKTDGSASSASSSLTYGPLSALTPTSEGTHSNWGNVPAKQSSSSLLPQKVDRKRRHSDANSGADASHSNSPSTSPIDEAKNSKIMAKESGKCAVEIQPSTEIAVLPSTTVSPSKVTSTTSDHETCEKQKLRTQQSKSPAENPLSSLQKLVDTTANKPVAPSSAFSEMHTSYPQHISLPGTLATARSSPLVSRPHSRTSGSQLQPMRQNIGTVLDSASLRSTVGIPFGSQSGMQTTTSSAEDTEMPALSALYAYVERSSPCQSQESASNLKESISPEGGEPNKLFDRSEVNLPRSLNSPFSQPSVYTAEAQSTVTQSSPPSETMCMTSQLQHAAFCAAILSNLTNSQHAVNSQGNTGALKDLPPLPPALMMPDAPQFVRDAANTSGGGNHQRNEMANHWWRMLQYMLSCGGSPNFPMFPSALTENDNSQSLDAEKVNTGLGKSETRPPESNNATGRNPFIQSTGCNLPPSSASLGLNSCQTSGSPGNASSIPPISVPSPQFMSSLANYRTQAPLPAAMSHRFNSNLLAQSLGGNLSGAGVTGGGIAPGLVSGIITKKAKCHFCGKPFANKGQVRLHISKNKCPCLLQQSCHVAALAAAFGGDTRRAGKHGFMNSGSQNNNNSLTSSSVTNRFSPSSGSQKQFQPHIMPLGSTGANSENSLGAPSALSLLKERFQNFELPLMSGQGNQQSQTHQQAHNVSTVTSPTSPIPRAVNSTTAPTTGTSLPTPLSDVSLSAIASCLPQNLPNLQNMIPTSSNSAANANHLAAMALLAQTLVQLTSTNTAPEPANSVSSEAVQKHQPPEETADSQPFGSLEALMPLLAASGGLDRKALFNSAQWFTHLANNPSYRGSTTNHKATDADEQFGQSTSGTSSDLCDGQLIGGRPSSTATPNGHI